MQPKTPQPAHDETQVLADEHGIVVTFKPMTYEEVVERWAREMARRYSGDPRNRTGHRLQSKPRRKS